jgi:hypothetical protein
MDIDWVGDLSVECRHANGDLSGEFRSFDELAFGCDLEGSGGGKRFYRSARQRNSRPARLASLESDNEVYVLPGVATALGWKGWATLGLYPQPRWGCQYALRVSGNYFFGSGQLGESRVCVRGKRVQRGRRRRKKFLVWAAAQHRPTGNGNG